MGSTNLNEHEILAALIQSDDELPCEDTDSEEADHQSEDEVQSDTEEGFVDEIQEEQPTPSGSNILEEQSNTEQPVSTSAFRRIVALQQRTVRGRNKYCWSTSKPTRRGRVSAVNVVQRGPSRVCRNIYDPVICFNMFFTDAIIMEIVRWTNAEISLKRRASMTGATFRDIDEDEIRALFGILVMTAVRKDNHMSTDELFDRYSSMLYVSVNDKHCLH
ncbi:unnamed protein product [Pieris macdunnoughi]|uniref:PiggyBac transposable element-derived protein domain-containing protein n=1 Tax=Pieris macdunnoughi TaxID=345717 RepID=A0A821LSI3_9NEOP|nr:unnamed protein product [Pieris macdunnoughi]